MKRLLLLISVFMASLSAEATHLMGGEITVQHIGGNDYLITMLVYRDTMGVPMQQNADFVVSDTSGVLFINTVSYDSVISGNLLPMYPYGVEVYLFLDTIQLTTPGMYEVAWSNCCRNHAIQNLTNPGGESMYLRTNFEVFANANNSTPFFLVPAAIFLPVNTPWQYNPLPFDPDGDSLYWSVDAPLRNGSTPCAGFVTPPGDTANPFSLNPVTGTISWTANTIGNFVATVLVEEYRNGVKIGDIRRDLQFIVTGPAASPMFTNVSSWPTDVNGYHTFTVVPGSVFQMSILANHADPMASLDMELYGELVDLTATPPSFSFATTGNGAEIEGTLNWVAPFFMNVGDKYLNAVRISDGLYTMDESFFIEIISGIGEEEKSLNEPKLYPNPAKDLIYVDMGHVSVDAELDVQVLNLYGQLVKEYPATVLLKGSHVLVLPLNEASGVYFVRINSEGNNWTIPFRVD